MKEGRTRFGRGSKAAAAVVAVAALGVGVVACGDDDSGGGGGGTAKKDEEVTIGLITKTETNPFFVKMKEGAQAQAKKSNVKLLTASGKQDTDNASQVTAMENMTTQGAKVILDVPADSKAIVPAIKKARDAGVIVIALDTPTEPQDAADALFATDNLKAGELIGQYAKAAVKKMGITPKIAMLDLAPGISVGQLRHDGFLKGFGIKEGDPQIVGAAPTLGDQAKGQAAMETLLQKDKGGRQGPEGLHPRVRRRWLQRDQERHQAGHHRRHLAAVPAEDGGAGRGEGRGGGARRREALGLRRHGRDADLRQPDGRGRLEGRGLRRGELLGLVRSGGRPRHAAGRLRASWQRGLT
jgi:ABC-type sugar transport system substrate-binding protein